MFGTLFNSKLNYVRITQDALMEIGHGAFHDT